MSERTWETLVCIVLVWAWCWTGAARAADFQGAPYEGHDLFADTWVATDGLGRTLPGMRECGTVKQEKWVGIFYWTWHTGLHHGAAGLPADNSKLLALAKEGRVPWPAGSKRVTTHGKRFVQYDMRHGKSK